ncbi:LysR substrate-binding domain-containing protein [Variovorax sp.]|nr:LysR substrate-binding domain-containing protein [Variovorax sp.]
MVEAGDADLGLGFFFRAAPSLDRTPVGRFELMRVTQAAADGEPVGSAPWSALRGAALIGLPPGNPIQKVIDRQLGEMGLADAQRPAFNFFGTLISMVEAGFGTAVMPTFALAACRRHRVRTDVLVKPRVGMDFFRVTKRGAHETEALRAFSETLRKALPALSH